MSREEVSPRVIRRMAEVTVAATVYASAFRVNVTAAKYHSVIKCQILKRVFLEQREREGQQEGRMMTTARAK